MELWTDEHGRTVLPALVLMLLSGIVLYRLLGKKDWKTRMLPIQILACILLAVEVGKQVLSLQHGYDLYHLPFHFCSLFIFMLPIMAFYRGKHHQKVAAVTAALCMAVLLLMLIYPNLIYGAGNIQAFFTDYFSFHTVFYHNLVMLAAVLILALKLYVPQKGDWKAVAWFMTGFCTVAASLAQILKTNFANFYRCNIPVLETVRQAVQNAIGAVFAQLIYVLIVALLHILFTLMAYGFCCLLATKIFKKASQLV